MLHYIESCSVDIQYKDMYGTTVKTKDYRMNQIWSNIGKLQLLAVAAQCVRRFPLSGMYIASISLAIPRSIADEEIIFSSVLKDKTEISESMNLDRTLSSLHICQLN